MVQGHSDVKGVSMAGEVLPSSLRPTYRLQRTKLNAPLIISTCTRLMSRHLSLGHLLHLLLLFYRPRFGLLPVP